MANTGDIRNIVLLGHGGSGKTSLAEAILHTTGITNRLGSVDDKSSVCDYYDEEKEHQHSISSAVINVNYNGKFINIIDTPGYPDFVGPAITPIPAADTAVIVAHAYLSGWSSEWSRLIETRGYTNAADQFNTFRDGADYVTIAVQGA